jgi:hypothetical protein
MMRSAFHSIALGLVALAALSTSAHAQDDAARAQAREQFAAGVQRYEAADYQGALEAFQEAYRLAPHPTVRVNMANCYEHLGRPLEALHHFERFLAEAADASRQQRREVQTAMQRLQQQVGEVRLAVAPDGALVTIDAAETRRAPILEPIRLGVGTHRVEVRMEGFRTARQEIEIIGGESRRVAIALERGQDAPVAAAEPRVEERTSEPTAETASEPTELTVAAAVTPEPTPAPAEEAGGFTFRFTPAVIVGGSLTIAFTIAALITGPLALGANGAFEDAVLRSNDASSTQADRDQARLDGLAAADSANTLSILTDVFVIGAIASAGVTTFFVIVDGMDGGGETASGEGPRLAVTPSAGTTGGGVVLTGTF